MTREELAAWLRLVEAPGVGAVLGRRLLAAFGGPAQVLDASPAALAPWGDATLPAALGAPDARLLALVDTTWAWLGASEPGQQRHLVTLGDARYPPRLLEIADPPLLLYGIGRIELLEAPGIAIVGSRRATPQGLDNARDFARQLGGRGLTVVSGLALGIDGAAHDGALDSPASTVAFVGTGLDRTYPARHGALARRIAAQGLLCSEYPLGMGALTHNFPRRNRLIAGASLGTLVVEAALQSGSLITARLAAESGREVFAIPGSIHAPQSRGCHALIQQGARLVESADDILEELRLPGAAPSAARHAPRQASFLSDAAPDAGGPADARAHPAGPGRHAALVEALGHDPVSFDALCARTGLSGEVLAARLLELELANAVHRLPGGLLQRRATA